MAKVHKLIRESVQKLPQFFLARLIAEKLREQNAPDKPGLAEAMAEHILSGRSEKFTWDDGAPTDEPTKNVTLSFSDQESAELHDSVLSFVRDKLPTVLQDASRKTAKSFLREIQARWPEQEAYERFILDQFRDSLEERWGAAFDRLRMLLFLAREMGESCRKRFMRSRRRKNLTQRGLLLRLHVRACQVTGEIVTLMENGFADGAMARWRTLYEIGVVATLIADAGEELAERYIAHEVVESKSALDEYERSWKELQERPVSTRDRRKVERNFAAAVSKYGKDFASPYGWAAKLIGNKNPNFYQLQRAAQRAAMHSYYKMASYNVHASAKGMFFRLGSLDDTLAYAGATNAGFVDPALNTASTLTQITGLLYEDRLSDPMVMVQMQIMILLRDEIAPALVRADRKLRRDHVAHTKQAAS